VSVTVSAVEAGRIRDAARFSAFKEIRRFGLPPETPTPAATAPAEP
jgi:hypothetical protein